MSLKYLKFRATLFALVLEGADPERARGAEPRRRGRVAVAVPQRLGDTATERLCLLGHIRRVPTHERIGSSARIVPVPDIVKNREAARAQVAIARGVDDAAALLTLD